MHPVAYLEAEERSGIPQSEDGGKEFGDQELPGDDSVA